MLSEQRSRIAHPKLLAAVSFGFSACVVAIALCTLERAVLGCAYLASAELVRMTLVATASAAISGMLVGSRFADPQTKLGRAAVYGMVVVALSHLLFVILMLPWEPGGYSIASVASCFLWLSLVVGIVTFPVGAIAGLYVVVLRDKLARPRGCRLHGYGGDGTGV
jgi:hypothetical protein